MKHLLVGGIVCGSSFFYDNSCRLPYTLSHVSWYKRQTVSLETVETVCFKYHYKPKLPVAFSVPVI